MNVVQIEISVRAAISVASIDATNTADRRMRAAASNRSATMGLVRIIDPMTGAARTGVALMTVVRVAATCDRSENRVQIAATTGIRQIVATPTPGETTAAHRDVNPWKGLMTTVARMDLVKNAAFQTPYEAAARILKIGVSPKIVVGRMCVPPTAVRFQYRALMFPHNGLPWTRSPRSGVPQLLPPILSRTPTRAIPRGRSFASCQAFTIETEATSQLLPSPPAGEGSGVRGRNGRETHIMN
jgi:hypothetical protein